MSIFLLSAQDTDYFSRSTDRKIQALEAKLNALRNANPSNPPLPSFASTSEPRSKANDGLIGMIGSDEWLESLLAKNKSTSGPVVKLDLSKAGLPNKPNFEGIPRDV